MARFFVGQRVRIVNVPTPRDGCEARIVGRTIRLHPLYEVAWVWDCDVDGWGTHNDNGSHFSYADEHLEPILPDGHRAGDYANVRDLMDALSSGVPA